MTLLYRRVSVGFTSRGVIEWKIHITSHSAGEPAYTGNKRMHGMHLWFDCLIRLENE